MPRADCTVCKHKDVALIDQTLKAGESIRKTAKRFGLSNAAIFRHMNHGEHAKSRINIGQIAHIDEEIKKLIRAQNRAKRKRNTSEVLAISRELRNWFVIRTKAEIVSIATKPDTTESAEVPQHELIALARALIESQLQDPDVQRWLLGLVERIQAVPVSDAETDEG
jgi:predicted DNA-binding transcriptional regulator AlpA